MHNIHLHFDRHTVEDIARIIEEDGALGSLYSGWRIERPDVQIYIDPLDPEQLAQDSNEIQSGKLNGYIDGPPAGSLAVRIGRQGRLSPGLLWASRLLREADGIAYLPDSEGIMTESELTDYVTASDTGQDLTVEELTDDPDPYQGHTRTLPETPFSREFDVEEPALEEACCIALIGDCTVEARSYPTSVRPQVHLRCCLNRAFPGWPFVIRNYGVAGGTARWFLEDRTIDRITAELPHLDIAFIRYGINDRKEDGIVGCINHLEKLCDQLKEAYPEVRPIIETSMWVDYPKHYMWDRNTRLAPLYEAMIEFAEQNGYEHLDIFRLMEAETKKGNWDLRIRNYMLDETFDHFFENDPYYFTNIHPNAKCMSLIARWETDLLKTCFA